MTLQVAHAIAQGVSIAFFFMVLLAAIATALIIKHEVSAVLALFTAGWTLTSLVVFIIAICIWLSTFPTSC